MNRRDEMIVGWVKEHRPDLIGQLKEALEGREGGNGALTLMLQIGFEAGRLFQHSDDSAELDNPNVYLREEPPTEFPERILFLKDSDKVVGQWREKGDVLVLYHGATYGCLLPGEEAYVKEGREHPIYTYTLSWIQHCVTEGVMSVQVPG